MKIITKYVFLFFSRKRKLLYGQEGQEEASLYGKFWSDRTREQRALSSGPWWIVSKRKRERNVA